MATPRKSKSPRRPRPAAKEVMSDAASPAIVSGTPSPSRVEPLRGPRIDSDEGGRYLDTPQKPGFTARGGVAATQARQ